MKKDRLLDYCKKLEQENKRLVDKNRQLQEDLKKKDFEVQKMKELCEIQIKKLSDTIKEAKGYRDKYDSAMAILKASKENYRRQFTQLFKTFKS